jgi:hypothetical protein
MPPIFFAAARTITNVHKDKGQLLLPFIFYYHGDHYNPMNSGSGIIRLQLQIEVQGCFPYRNRFVHYKYLLPSLLQK